MTAASLLLAALMSQPAALGDAVRFERLENGLRIVIVEDHSLPLVSVQLWVRVGSAIDDPKTPGLCHVARTLLATRDDAEVRLAAAGIHAESRTLPDACVFAATLPAGDEMLRYAIEIEAERLRPLKSVTTTQLATALRNATMPSYLETRPIELYPAGRYADALSGSQPDDAAGFHACNDVSVQQVVLAAAFADHPYQHPAGFVAAPLRDIRTERVTEFIDRWFVPANATLFVIGDISTPAALELVRSRFAALPWREPPRQAEFDLPAHAVVRGEFPPAPGLRLRAAWVTPPRAMFDYAAIDVLMHRLCNALDGPLARRLMERGLAVRWRHTTARHAGLLVMEVADSPFQRAKSEPSPAEIERMITDELQRAADATPSEIELNRARALADRDLLAARDGFDRRAFRVAATEMVGGDIVLFDVERPRVAGVNVGDLRRVAALLLAARTVWLAPGSATIDQVGTMQPIAASQPARTSNPAVFGAAEPMADLRTPAADAPIAAVSGWPAAAVTRVVANGEVQLRLVPVAGLETACVRTIPLVPEASPAVLQALLTLGSAALPGDQLADYVSFHGISQEVYWHARGAGLQSRGTGDQLARMIELQADLLTHPNLGDEALRSARDVQLAAFAAATRDPAQLANVLAAGAVGLVDRRAESADAVRPLAAASALLESDASALKQRLLDLGFPAAFRGPHVQVTIVGDFNVNEVARFTEDAWLHALRSRWAGASAPATASAPASAAREPPSLVGAPATSPSTAVAQPPTRILWIPSAAGRAELRVVWLIDGSERPEVEGIPWVKDEFAAAHAGARPGTTVFGDGPGGWRVALGPHTNMVFAAALPPEACAAEAGALIERLRNLAPERDDRLALRLASAMRLVSLQGAVEVAATSERYVGLWNMNPEGIAHDLRSQWLNKMAHPPPRAIVVIVGGDQSLRSELHRLGEVSELQP